MSNAGQAVLSVVGGVVGYMVGGPSGAAWGFQLGGLAGSVAFPTDLGTVSGPRLNDLNVQTSTVGAPIPIVYGSYALSGNLIWSGGIVEVVSRQKQGGKGGPTQTVKTYSYYVDCAVGVCEGEITGILRIWADAKVIYDARPQFADETDEDYATRVAANEALLAKTEIYLGTSYQDADPTIESFEGVGNVSAFRDLAYVVFSEFQLEDYGNRVPNFRFEVNSVRVDCIEANQYSNSVMYPWIDGSADPRDPRNDHLYWYAGVLRGTFDQAITAAIDITGRPLGETVYGWEDDQIYVVYPHSGPGVSNDLRALNLHINDEASIGGRATGDISPAIMPCTVESLFNPTTYWTGEHAAGNLESGLWYVGTSRADMGVAGTGSGSFACAGSKRAYFNRDVALRAERVPSSPGDEWTYVSGTARALANLDQANLSDPVNHYPLNPALPAGHADYSSQAFWEAAYTTAVADGDLPGGWTYGVEYPQTNDFYYVNGFGACPEIGSQVMLGSIVRDICERCGLEASQIDVTDLTEMVDGYVISRVMSGRDAISPLRTYGWFDCVESDGQLKWPTRGKAAVATLVADDLAAHESGSTRPSEVESDRTQEVELPRRLRVHYAQTAMNYEPGEQSASRFAAGDVEIRDIEVAVAMSSTKAAQIADVLLYDSWVSRNRHRVTIDTAFLALEPADAITAPVDGRQERLRIASIDHSLPGLLRLDCVRDDDGVYVSYAVGAPSGYLGPVNGGASGQGTADLILLDLPLLRDEDNDAGYYAAIATTGSGSWAGAVLYRSADGGANYDPVATATLEATVGTVVSALPSGPTGFIDEGNELVVELSAGDLESISETSLLAGLNAAAIGADGRWEIVQFRDVILAGSPPTYTLTGLLRGRRGTEWVVGTSQVGDRFVLLDSALVRVTMNLAAIGAVRQHKPVLAGSNLEAATAEEFAGNAVALKPFSPVDVQGAWDAGDLTITWVRRGRIGSELPSGSDIPLSEESEAYEIDILDGSTVVRTLTATTPSVTYTEAQQVEDFGSPTPLTVDVQIFQMSASVGRGYAAEATL